MIAAWIYLTVLISSIFTIYDMPVISPLTPAIMATTGIILLAYRWVNRHRLIGSVAVVAAMYAWFRVVLLLADIGMSRSGVRFWQWMLTGGDEVERNIYFLAAMLLSCSVFFTTIIFYYTEVKYRVSMIVLAGLMPCLLYIKVMATMDNYLMALIALAAMGVFISHGRLRGAGVRIVDNGSFIIGGLMFSGVVLVLTALIPKSEDAIFYNEFENLFLQGDTTSVVSGDYSERSSYSGNAEGFFDSGSRRLYTVYGDGYTYLKRQNFDYYDSAKHWWYPDEALSEADIPLKQWLKEHESIRRADLLNAVKRGIILDPSLPERYGLDRANLSRPYYDKVSSWIVQAENFSPSYYLTTSMNLKIKAADDSVYADSHGNYVRAGDASGDNGSYEITFLPDSGYMGDWFSNGLMGLDSDALTFLEELKGILNSHGFDSDSVDTYIDMEKMAADYARRTNDSTQIPERIVDLAKTVTANLEHDYEKAEALQNYFHSEGYVYDLDYRAPDKSIEYFLFVSKRGTCSEYATAYTLMARSVGLTVRYAEGFMPEISGSREIHYIKEGSSHAYPEVYLPLTGWTIYEPTVATVNDRTKDILGIFSDIRADYGLAGAIIVVLSVLTFLIGTWKLLWPILKELAFRMWLLSVPVDKGVKGAMNRLLIGFGGGLTVRELAEELKKVDVDIAELVQLAEAISYRELSPDTTISSRQLMILYVRAYRGHSRLRKLYF